MRRPGLSLGAVLLVGAAVAAIPLLGLVLRSWPWRVAVEGHSMEPTLRAGDWLLVDPLAYAGHNPQAGQLVVACDPRRTDRWLIKRAADVLPDGRLTLAGDHPAHRDEDLGSLEPDALIGRPWLRYRPLRRFGRLG
jgi:signal peptidase I